MDIQITMDDVRDVMAADENVRLKLTNQALRRIATTLEGERDALANIPAKPGNGRVRSGSSRSRSGKD